MSDYQYPMLHRIGSELSAADARTLSDEIAGIQRDARAEAFREAARLAESPCRLCVLWETANDGCSCTKEGGRIARAIRALSSKSGEPEEGDRG